MAPALKTAALGITGAFVALLLRKREPELAAALSVATAAVVLGLVLAQASGIVDFLTELAEAASLSAAQVAPVVKTVGIGLVTRLASDVCREAGQTAASTAVETAGAICAILAALPLMRAVFAMIGELL